jgi:hypothetical protein
MAAAFVLLAELASALLVGFRLAGGDGVHACRRGFDRQGDDVDRGACDRADDASAKEECKGKKGEHFH